MPYEGFDCHLFKVKDLPRILIQHGNVLELSAALAAIRDAL
jgi:hypothetical protein